MSTVGRPQSPLGIKLQDERADTIPCPMFRTMLNTGRLQLDTGPDAGAVDAQGRPAGRIRLSDLNDQLTKLGVPFGARVALRLAAKAVDGGILSALNPFKRSFSVYNLFGSFIDGP